MESDELAGQYGGTAKVLSEYTPRLAVYLLIESGGESRVAVGCLNALLVKVVFVSVACRAQWVLLFHLSRMHILP
jgi:hypothetical protein